MRKNFVSNLAKVASAHDRIGRAALQAAAIVVVSQARRNVRGGFTTGEYVTGNLARSVTWDVQGFGYRLRAFVGTPVDYGAFWEFGFHMRGGGYSSRSGGRSGYYRVPWLEPAMRDTVPEQQAAAQAAAVIEAKKLAVALNLAAFGLAGTRRG